MTDMDLVGDLFAARDLAAGIVPCGLCAYLESMPSGLRRSTLIEAAAGTIGVTKLAGILLKHSITDPTTGKPVGRRTIIRHRAEGHKP